MAALSPPEPLLCTRGLSRQFGGLRAVDCVDLDIDDGEIRAVIGPNGAGKTTLVSLISGRLSATSGSIAFKGRDITRARAWVRARRGIVYTFQITSIFRNLTCYENVALAAQRRLIGNTLERIRLDERRVAGCVTEGLDRVGLTGVSDQRAGELPYGHQRLLEVAMALAVEPVLLILDEPTQGLARGEISAFCELVRTISTHSTVLLIEHNMSVVLELADRITVMDNGGILAEGSPAEIEGNLAVQRAYLGS